MTRQVEIEGKIETLQRQLNAYIEREGFDRYEELLQLSRKLDRVIAQWAELQSN